MTLHPRKGFQHFLHDSDLELGGAFTVWLATVCLTLATLVRSAS